MGLRDIEILDKYRSDSCDDIGQEFISKALTEATIYKRAVGYFSSSSLLSLCDGLTKFLEKDDCKIYLIVSPVLTEDDIDSIEKGYKNRESLIESTLLKELNIDFDLESKEKLNLLSHLIQYKILDIKVALTDDLRDASIYHEKIGLFEDEDKNKIAFSGSLNESNNAFSHNFESIMVFKNWEEPKRVNDISHDFDDLWANRTTNLTIYNFPEAAKNKILKYKKFDCPQLENNPKYKEERKRPFVNLPFDLHKYQREAIQKWHDQNCCGLFNMGTGTGKTITALTAAVELLQEKQRLATVIVCPYTHLVEQWMEEKDHFNIDFIAGYSNKKYKNYYNRLDRVVNNYNDGIIDYFYFVTTIDTFTTPKVQSLLKRIEGDALFIADEVHNFGAPLVSSCLLGNFKYRIGLSATIDRHMDEEGTDKIYKYFGKVCINYGLKEAIANNVLTRYYYYPILVYMDEDERYDYTDLTYKINKLSNFDPPTKEQDELLKQLKLKRSRLIASINDKYGKLKNQLSDKQDEKNILVYCGTANFDCDNGEEIRQINKVCDLLGNEMNFKLRKYTAEESPEDRKNIAESFKNGDLQAIIAIKCLDEGVNIPCIKSAYILASSTNPREYVQRRGRVLRKFEGKDYSYIYDFVVLPFPIEKAKDYQDKELKLFKSLINRETARIKEFSDLAENSYDSSSLIFDLESAFGLYNFDDNNEINNEEF